MTNKFKQLWKETAQKREDLWLWQQGEEHGGQEVEAGAMEDLYLWQQGHAHGGQEVQHKSFKDFWKNAHAATFEKTALTKSEILEVQDRITKLQSKGLPSSKIITALQKLNPKLSERWKAERAYWTEVKKDDTDTVGEAGDDLGISKYKVILSPNACPTCVHKTSDGSKIFKNSDLEKSGYGHVPPFHPNCYCILIPVE